MAFQYEQSSSANSVSNRANGALKADYWLYKSNLFYAGKNDIGRNMHKVLCGVVLMSDKPPYYFTVSFTNSGQGEWQKQKSQTCVLKSRSRSNILLHNRSIKKEAGDAAEAAGAQNQQNQQRSKTRNRR